MTSIATLSRLSLVCVASGLIFLDAPNARGGQTTEPPHSGRRIEMPVTLIVEGSSRPAAQELIEARQQASMIYDAIDVSLVWMNESGSDEETVPLRVDDPPPMHLVAIVLSDARTERFLKGSELPPSILGVAPHQTNRVYLFWDRIVRRARDNDVLPQIVLARVLAHEIGHHLLPAQGHSDRGIMRPSLDYRLSEPPAFTTAQAEAIKTFLAGASLGD